MRFFIKYNNMAALKVLPLVDKKSLLKRYLVCIMLIVGGCYEGLRVWNKNL